jgi:uncharacterized membrane protein
VVALGLSPEERRKIYEEEKARIEQEQKQKAAAAGSTTGLEPNVAGLLCYLGAWVTGIIFLVIEQKSRFVRFHALQSIITFGILTIASGLLSWIPFVGTFFRAVIGILAFVLWIVLMVEAYQGKLFKVPLAGDIADSTLKPEPKEEQPEPVTGQGPTGTQQPKGERAAEPVGSAISRGAERFGRRAEEYFARSRAGRIAGYGAAIFWDIVLIIFFTSFYQYIAWYHVENGVVTRLPMLTNDYFSWLPILVTALALSIAGNILLIVNDRYWMRGIVRIILNVIGVIVVANLISIFPFNFQIIPNPIAVEVVPTAVRIFLILIAVGLGVGAFVELVKLIVNAARQDKG